MKVKIELDIEDVEQARVAQICLKANNVAEFLDFWYQEVFRPHIKYGTPLKDGKQLSERDLEVIEMLSDKMSEYLESLDLV